MATRIHNPHPYPFTLPFPFQGIIPAGQYVAVKLSVAEVKEKLGGTEYRGGLRLESVGPQNDYADFCSGVSHDHGRQGEVCPSRALCFLSVDAEEVPALEGDFQPLTTNLQAPKLQHWKLENGQLTYTGKGSRAVVLRAIVECHPLEDAQVEFQFFMGGASAGSAYPGSLADGGRAVPVLVCAHVVVSAGEPIELRQAGVAQETSFLLSDLSIAISDV